jgi:hypothetical protein
VGDNDIFFESMDPMDVITKVMRKENMKLITMGRCKPMEENKQRCKFLMENI